MQWGSSLSRQQNLSSALDECMEALAAQLDDPIAADFAAVFASPHYDRQNAPIAAAVRERFPHASIVGCSGAGIIGSGHEEEDAPALSLTVGILPDVTRTTFHLSPEDLPSPDAPPDAWANLLHTPTDSDPHFVILADPFTMDAEALLAGLDYAYPNAAKIGGLASGGNRLAPHGLFLDDTVHRSGAIGIALTGNIVIDTVVAQGCRPIGEAKRVSEADRNVVVSIAGETALDSLQSLYASASRETRNSSSATSSWASPGPARRNRVCRRLPHPQRHRRRPAARSDSRRRARARGPARAVPRPRRRNFRDDLRESLAVTSAPPETAPLPPRSSSPAPDADATSTASPIHDTGIFRSLAGELPLGGFFCNGEIGPRGRHHLPARLHQLVRPVQAEDNDRMINRSLSLRHK